MHDDRVNTILKPTRHLRSPARSRPRRHVLRLGTCLTGAAAALLIGTAPAAAAPACGLLTLTAVTCPASSSYPGGIHYGVGAGETPQDLTVHLGDGVAVETGDDYVNGINVTNFSGGAAAVIADGASTIATQGTGSIGVAGNTDAGDLTIHVGSVSTQGSEAHGVVAGSVSGAVDVQVGAVKTGGAFSDGVHVSGYSGAIGVSAGSVETSGLYSRGIYGVSTQGSLTIDAGSVTTHGDYSVGIDAQAGQPPVFDEETGQTVLGAPTDLTVHADSVKTGGYASDGVIATNFTMGETKVSIGAIATTGDESWGAYAGGFGNVSLSAGTVETSGTGSAGMGAVSIYGNVDISADSVTTHGDFANGINVLAYGTDAQLTITAGSVTTDGNNSAAIYAGGSAGYLGENHKFTVKADSVTTNGINTAGVVVKTGGDVDVDLGTVTINGDRSRGVIIQNADGDVTLNIDSIVTKGAVALGRDAVGLSIGNSFGTVDATIGSITTAGDHSPAILTNGVYSDQHFTIGSLTTTGDNAAGFQSFLDHGNLTLEVGAISTSGDDSPGVYAQSYAGDTAIKAGQVTTGGSNSTGIKVTGVSTDGLDHQIAIDAGTITTKGDQSSGVDVLALGNDATIHAGSVTTGGAYASGIKVSALRGYSEDGTFFGGDVTVDAGTVVTTGDDSRGIETRTDGKTTITAVSVTTSGANAAGIHAYGYGDIAIDAGTVKTSGYRSDGINANNNVGGLSGGITITAGEVSTTGALSNGIRAAAYYGSTGIKADKVTTTGYGSEAVYGWSYYGNVDIDVGSVATSGTAARGVVAYSGGTTTINVGDVTTSGANVNRAFLGTGIKAVGAAVHVTAGSVSTAADYSAAIYANSNFVHDNGQAERDISVTAGTLVTTGFGSDGVDAINIGRGGNIAIDVGSISTRGDYAFGVYSYAVYGSNTVTVGDIATRGKVGRGIDATSVYGDVTITGNTIATKGDYSYGVLAKTGGARFSAGETLAVDVGEVTTEGFGSDGIRALSLGRQMDTVINAGSVKTSGDYAYGINAYTNGVGNAISITAGTIETSGKEALGIQAVNLAVAGDISIDVGSITNHGDVSAAIFAYSYDGKVSIDAGTVTGGAISVSARYGDVDVKAGTVTSDHYNSTGIAVNGQNISVKVDKVEETGTLGVGILALGAKTVLVDAGEILTATEGGFGVVAEGTDVTVNVGKVKTTGPIATGIYAAVFGTGNNGDITVTDALSTAGDISDGVFAISGGTIGIHNRGTLETSGQDSRGIVGFGMQGVTIDGTGTITTSGERSLGVLAQALGGTVSVSQAAISTSGHNAAGLYAGVYGASLDGQPLSGDIRIDVGSVSTSGDLSDGIVAVNAAQGGGIDITAGTVTTTGAGSAGIVAIGYSGAIRITAGDVTTTGDFVPGQPIGDYYYTAPHFNHGIYAVGASVDVTATGAVSTRGDFATGIYAAALDGKVTIHARDVATTGDKAAAVRGYSASEGVSVTTTGTISTSGRNAYGVLAFGAGPLDVTNSGDIATSGQFAHGIYALGGTGAVSTVSIANSGKVATSGEAANAVRAISHGGDVDVVSTGTVEASGKYASGVLAVVERPGRGGDKVALAEGEAEALPMLTVDVGKVTVSGEGSAGVVALSYRGDVSVKAQAIDASKGGAGLSTISAGTTSIEVGNVSSGGRGILTISAGDAEATVTGSVIAPNHVAIEMNSFSGDTVLNIGKGATVIGGGQHNPADDPYVGIGNAVILGSYTGVTLNNAGTIRNLGDGYTVYMADLGIGDELTTVYGAAITNSGLIEGNVKMTAVDDTFVNSGRFDATKDSDFGAGRDVFTNSGILAVSSGTSAAARAAAAPVSVTFKGLERFENSGLIDLRGGAAGDTLTLTGDYFGSGNAQLGLDLGKGVADKLVIQGAATGSTGIVLNQSASDATLLTKPIELVKVGAGSASTAFHMAAPDVGLVHYALAYEAGSFGLTAQAGAPVYRLARIGEGAQAIWDQSAQAWSSHMMQLRDDVQPAARLWGQVYGGVSNRDAAQAIGSTDYALDYRQDFYGFQVGMDLGGSMNDAGSAVFGVTAGYISSRQNFERGGDRAEFDTVNVGAYGSVRRGALFGNALGQYAHHAIDAHGRVLDWSDKTSGDGYGLQGEIGARLGSDKVFVEPLASLAWQKTDIAGLNLLGQSIEFGKLDGLTGKLGARIGGTARVFGTEAVFYARGSWVHQFEGRPAATLVSGGTSESIEGRRMGDYGQAALGVTILSEGPVSGFVEGNATFGSSTRGGGGRAGVRFKF
ncbi:pertactin-like passenger domain-containing protein [Novosphingobium sp. 11B]